jgi:hypothetical protein
MLSVKHGDVIADHIGELRIMSLKLVVDVRVAVSTSGLKHRRVPPRVEEIARWDIKREAEAEAQPVAHFGDTLSHLLRGQEIETPALVVRTEVAPVRTRRAPDPSRAGPARRRHCASGGQTHFIRC